MLNLINSAISAVLMRKVLDGKSLCGGGNKNRML